MSDHYTYVMSNGATLSLGPMPDAEKALDWLRTFTPEELSSLSTLLYDIALTYQGPGKDMRVPFFWLGAISKVSA